jgi:flagellar hook-associated protein FlgK
MKKITIENKRTLKNKNKYDLTRLLYFGGASFKVQDAYKKISNGELQGPIDEREELITAFRDALQGEITSGHLMTTLMPASNTASR